MISMAMQEYKLQLSILTSHISYFPVLVHCKPVTLFIILFGKRNICILKYWLVRIARVTILQSCPALTQLNLSMGYNCISLVVHKHKSCACPLTIKYHMGGQPAISCRAYAEVYFELLITYCMTAMFFWYLFNLKNRHSFGVYVDGREATEVQMDIGRGLNIHSMASPVKCGGGGGVLRFWDGKDPFLKPCQIAISIRLISHMLPRFGFCCS